MLSQLKQKIYIYSKHSILGIATMHATDTSCHNFFVNSNFCFPSSIIKICQNEYIPPLPPQKKRKKEKSPKQTEKLTLLVLATKDKNCMGFSCMVSDCALQVDTDIDTNTFESAVEYNYVLEKQDFPFLVLVWDQKVIFAPR